MYCYIRNGELTETSDTLITKHIAPLSEVIDEDGSIVQEAVPGVDGMVYDSVIETTLTGRVEYLDGEIVEYTPPIIVLEPKEAAKVYIQSTPSNDLVPVTVDFSDKEIGAIITDKVFEGNKDAQLASLMKGQVATLQLIVGINPAFKAIINASLSDLITQLREISKVREATGLSAIDLSFLD